jgi:hypothetical protein
MNPKNSDLVNEVERFFRPFKVLFDPSREKELLGLIERFAEIIGTIIFEAKNLEESIEYFDVAVDGPDFEEFFKSFQELTLTPDDKNPLGKPLEFLENPAIPVTINRHLLDATDMLVALLAIAGMPRQNQIEHWPSFQWLVLELTRRITRGFQACAAILVFLEKETSEGVIPREIRIDRKEMEALFEEIKQAIESEDSPEDF